MNDKYTFVGLVVGTIILVGGVIDPTPCRPATFAMSLPQQKIMSRVNKANGNG